MGFRGGITRLVRAFIATDEAPNRRIELDGSDETAANELRFYPAQPVDFPGLVYVDSYVADEANPKTLRGVVVVNPPRLLGAIGEGPRVVLEGADLNGSAGAIVLEVPGGQVALPFGTDLALFGDLIAEQLPLRFAAGQITITPSAANTPTAARVTFPPGRFTRRPIVLATAATNVPGTQVTGVGVFGADAAGTFVDVYVTRTNTTATIVTWIAVQMPF